MQAFNFALRVPVFWEVFLRYVKQGWHVMTMGIFNYINI